VKKFILFLLELYFFKNFIKTTWQNRNA